MVALRPIYSSVSHVTDEYMGSFKVKPDGPYICRFLAQTDKYNVLCIGFKTDKYNLNIYVGTDEYIIIDE
jgi:hypothetical protein